MSVLTRFLNLFRQQMLDREFDDELWFHLEKRIDEKVRKGMTQADARAEAYREFGNLNETKHGMRKVRIMKIKTSVVVPVLVSIVVCAGVGSWLWFQRSRPASSPRIYQVSDAGITPPAVILERKPSYPSEALKSRIEGDVVMKCVVQTNGLCDDIQVTKSLDPMWLDVEATKAIQEWRFKPGTRNGDPVPVMVNVEFRFAVR